MFIADCEFASVILQLLLNTVGVPIKFINAQSKAWIELDVILVGELKILKSNRLALGAMPVESVAHILP